MRNVCCIIITETDTFTSNVTEEIFKINYRFDCNDKCLVYLMTCNKCKKNTLVKVISYQFRTNQTNFEVDGATASLKGGVLIEENSVFKNFWTNYLITTLVCNFGVYFSTATLGFWHRFFNRCAAKEFLCKCLYLIWEIFSVLIVFSLIYKIQAQTRTLILDITRDVDGLNYSCLGLSAFY